MHCLPIIYRELQIAARAMATYRQRMLAAGSACAVVVLFALFTPSLSSTSGHYLFKVVSWGGFIICFLEGLRETADCLAQERREGTLGLLFLTDLRGYDIILGKLSAACVKSFTTLLAMVPAFALPIWLGGVTAGEFWRVTAALAIALLFSMTVGIFISANSRSVLGALIGSFLLAAMLVLIPAASIALHGPLPGWVAGPLGMFLFASDSQVLADPWLFWKAFLYSVGLGMTLCAIASRCVCNFSGGEEYSNNNSLWQRLLRPTAGYSAAWASPSSSGDPAAWLAERTLPGRKMLWLLVAFAAALCFAVGCFAGDQTMNIVFPIVIFFVFLMKLWVAVLAIQPFHSARRSGALELILCTPVTPRQLIVGQINALRGYFLLPGLAACFALTISGALGNMLFGHSSSGIAMSMIGLCFGGIWFLLFLLDLNALAYMGLWFGLTEPQIPKAVTKTVFRVLLLPWLITIIPCVGMLAVLIVPWACIDWANKKLNQRLHQEAASQFSTLETKGWFKSKRTAHH